MATYRQQNCRESPDAPRTELAIDVLGSPAGLIFSDDRTRAWLIIDDVAGGNGPTDPIRAARLALIDTGERNGVSAAV